MPVTGLEHIRPNVNNFDETRHALSALERNIQILAAAILDVALDDVVIDGSLSIDSLSGVLKAVAGLVSGNAKTIDLADYSPAPATTPGQVGVWDGTKYVPGTVMAAGAAPIGAPFVTTAADATLTNASVLTEGEGIDVTLAPGTVTVSGEDASATNKGIAKFDAKDFLVTSGDVADLHAIATKTANYLMVLADDVILADASAGPISITLPPVGAAIGRIYYVKRINLGPNSVTVLPE